MTCCLTLNRNRLHEILEGLGEQLARTLERLLADPECRPDPALRAAVPLADAALGLDLGGSLARSALVRWGKAGARVEKGPLVVRTPWQRGVPFAMERFLDLQAELIEDLAPAPGLPLGYAFSFPIRLTGDGDARLIRWTKGVEVPEMIGRRVGRLLAQRIAARGRVCCGPVRVLNDSLALLYAGEGRDAAQMRMGLVVGTGTNLALAWPVRLAAGGEPDGEAALNLESGDFFLPHLTEWDADVDAASENPGRQRLEKALSGMYLNRMLARICTARGGGPPPLLESLADAAPAGSDAGMLHLARALVRRSAQIAAALLTAAVDLRHRITPIDTVRVVAVGGLLRGRLAGRCEYMGTLVQTLNELLKEYELGHVRVKVCTVPDATLVGAARAALTGRWGCDDDHSGAHQPGAMRRRPLRGAPDF